MDNGGIDFRESKTFSKDKMIIMDIGDVYMPKKNSNKDAKRRNSKNRKGDTKNRSPPVKIAYYTQKMLEKEMGTKEIIMLISSQFGNRDVREFADAYRCCVHNIGIRRIADLIYNIPKRRLDDIIDVFSHDVMIKKGAFLTKYLAK